MEDDKDLDMEMLFGILLQEQRISSLGKTRV
jgi:hypothetical protein